MSESPNEHSQLVPVDPLFLSVTGQTKERILSAMIDEAIVLARKTSATDSGEMVLKRRNILIVEGEEEMAELTKLMLESSGFAVITASDAFEGLRCVTNEDFDVIICTWYLPVMDGDCFYDEVENLKPHLCERFIFTAGRSANVERMRIGDRTAEEVMQRINSTFLRMPFSRDSLLEAVEKVIANNQTSKDVP